MYSEKTLRRKASNIGYRIQKGPLMSGNLRVAYGDPGYSIIDCKYNTIVYGLCNGFYNLLQLEDVEEFLRDEYDALELAF